MKELKKIYVKKKNADGTYDEFYADLDSANQTQNELIQANSDAIAQNTQNDASVKDEILQRIAELQLSVTERIEALKQQALSKEDFEVKEASLNAKLQSIESNISELKTASILTDALQSEVEALSEVVSTKKSNVAVTNVTELENATISSDEDVVLTTSETLAQPLNVTARNVELDNVKINNSVTSVTSTGIVNFNGFVSTGTQDKTKQGNANVKINNLDVVRLINSKFLNTGYNTVEIGLDPNSKPSSVVINNCEFGDTSNNSVLIFNTADNAIITVKNCKFGNTSNPLRLSNRDNVHVTLNVINCDFAEIEKTAIEYRSLILLQDYKSTTAEQAIEANRFSSDKVKINFVNCTLRGQRLSEVVLGTGEDKPNSLAYVYSVGSLVTYEGNESRYPEVTIA